MNKEILLAGFGGQGILFAGKFLTYCGLIDDKEVSWLPSYGPEMRGGTANCSVQISDNEISCPLINNPDVLLVMNLPSYTKFIDTVKPNGVTFIDSSLIDQKSNREDIECHYIPATDLAIENKLTGMANIILCGYLIKSTGIFSEEIMLEGLKKCVPPNKAALIEKNMTALKLGFNYTA